MSFFFDTRETEAVQPDQISIGPPTGFFENLSASFGESVATDLLVSRGAVMAEARAERRKVVEDLTGKPFEEIVQPFRPAPSVFPDSEMELTDPEQPAVEAFRAGLPAEKQGLVLTEKQLEQRAKEIALERVARNKDVKARAQGIGATAGQLTGAIGAQFKDPLVVATLPFGAASSSRLIVAMGVEAAIAGAVDAASQPAVQKWRKQLGLKSGPGEAVKNVLLTSATAAGAVPVLRFFGRLLMGLPDRDLARAHREIFPDPDPDQAAARTRLEGEADFAEDTPFAAAPRGQEEHARRADEAARVMEEDATAPDLPDPPPDVARPPRPALGDAPPADAAPGRIYQFDPDDLEVAARRFQFKEGADDLGVTDRLEGVQRWDPTRAGIVLAWEDAAGRRFIVDGHQRRALAKRIKDADPAQAPRLQGFILREADDVTEADARAIAASKNIAEGTGSAIDAAKILRDRPEIGVDLPPNSALVRDATGLARLSDDAFGMVVNDIVPANFASIVGRLAPDQPETHAQVLKTLADTEPANLTEAESIVRDVLSAPQVREIQDDLFGSGETTQILFKERARVLANAAKRIRQDRRAFTTLVREENRIRDAGNVLDTEANVARAQDDGQILATIQKLSRRKGPVADALARAAQDLSGGARLGDVTQRFVDDVRRAVDAERPGGRGDGGGGRDGEGGDDGGAPPAGDERPGGGQGPDTGRSAAGVTVELDGRTLGPRFFHATTDANLTADRLARTFDGTINDEGAIFIAGSEEAASNIVGTAGQRGSQVLEVRLTRSPRIFDPIGNDDHARLLLEANERADNTLGLIPRDDLDRQLRVLRNVSETFETGEAAVLDNVFVFGIARQNNFDTVRIRESGSETLALLDDSLVDRQAQSAADNIADSPGTRDLDDVAQPAPATPQPLRAADEALDDLAEPDGPQAVRQTQTIEARLRREIGAGDDFDVPIDETGATRQASELFDELDADRQFADSLETCLR